MNRSSRARGGLDEEESGVIRVGGRPGPEAEEARRMLALTVFVRIVAMLWIAQALEQWLRIIAPAQGSFADLTPATMTAIIFFAVLNPVAAVGLWLLAPWGGVVWLLTLVAQIFVAWSKPSFFLLGGALKLADAALFALYLFLSWRADSLYDEPSAIETIIARLRELARLDRGGGGGAGKTLVALLRDLARVGRRAGGVARETLIARLRELAQWKNWKS